MLAQPESMRLRPSHLVTFECDCYSGACCPEKTSGHCRRACGQCYDYVSSEGYCIGLLDCWSSSVRKDSGLYGG